ncbi:MAG: methionine synthase [Chitinivibrionales bacterium]|nr:methionine synthase [Chitinivibrionales bacterium]
MTAEAMTVQYRTRHSTEFHGRLSYSSGSSILFCFSLLHITSDIFLEQPYFFTRIPIEIPERMVLIRLGYNRRKTTLSADQKSTLDRNISDGFSLCELRGCYMRMDIEKHEAGKTVLEDGSELTGTSLAKLLQNSHAVALMASTAGPDIVQAAAKSIDRGDGATGVIYDAVGGQSADAALGWINEYVRQSLSRKREHLTKRRFSPGYGDVALENQKSMYRLLDLERLGLQLTPGCMLVPEKSVTAIAGIEQE